MLRSADKKLHVGDLLTNAILPPARARFHAEIMRDSPVAFWPMQEKTNTNPLDYSGNGRDMTSTSAGIDFAESGPMPGSYSVLLNGGESIQRSSVVSTLQNDWTFMFWLKPGAWGAADQIIFHNGAEASSGWGARGEADGAIRGLAGGVAEQDGAAFHIEGPQIGWNLFHYQRVSTDSNRWKYYINGALNEGNAGTTNPNVPSGTVQIGDTSVQFWIAYVAVFDSALSAARIAAHYAASRDSIESY